MKPTAKFILLLTVALAATVGGAPGTAVHPFGLPYELWDYVVYYNGFESPDWGRSPEINQFGDIYFEVDADWLAAGGVDGGKLRCKGYVGAMLNTPEFSFSKGRTISVWFRTEEDPNEGNILTLTGNGHISIFFRNGPWCGLTQPAGAAQVHGVPGIPDSNVIFEYDFVNRYPKQVWHQAVIASNGKSVAWYLDGELVFSRDLESQLSDQAPMARLEIGGPGVEIDELAVFDAVLTREAVAEYYNWTTQFLKRAQALR